MRILAIVMLLAGCGAWPMEAVTPDAGPTPAAWEGIADFGGGAHPSCAPGGAVFVHLATPDCAGLEAAAAPIPCPGGGEAVLTCSEAPGAATVTLDCGPGCSVSFPVNFR